MVVLAVVLGLGASSSTIATIGGAGAQYPPGSTTTATTTSTTTTSTTTAPGAEPGSLVVEVMPSALVLRGAESSKVDIVVTNAGASTVGDFEVEVRPPEAGVTWVELSRVGVEDGRVPAGGVVHVEGRLQGRLRAGGPTVVEVRGTTAGRSIVDTVALTHGDAPALATVSIVGDTRLTNGDDLEAVVRVANPGSAPIEVDLCAETSGQGDDSRRCDAAAEEGEPETVPRCGPVPPPDPDVDRPDRIRIAVPTIVPGHVTVAPGATVTAKLGIGGHDLPSRKETATVVARVSTGPTCDVVVADHVFETAPFGDGSLVTSIGLGSLLLVPGFVAVAAWSLVRSIWRRRRGVAATWIPAVDALATLVPAILVSALVLAAISAGTEVDLYAGYGVRSLAEASAWGLLAGLAVGFACWIFVGWRRPVLTPDSEPEAVFWRTRHWTLPQAKVDGATGLVLWRGSGAVCLVRPLVITSSNDEWADEVQRLTGTKKAFRITRLRYLRARKRIGIAFAPELPAEWVTAALTSAVPEKLAPSGQVRTMTDGG